MEVGTDVTHADLLDHFHAVIYTTGASIGRSLGIPGEDLDGCESATDFVAWYNGHPDAADHHFDLSSHRAVVIGNGNVALDVARMLMLPEAKLRETDVADHALDVLARRRHPGGGHPRSSRCGRGGVHDPRAARARVLHRCDGARGGRGRVARRAARRRVRAYSATSRSSAGTPRTSGPTEGRTIVLRFMTSPVAVLGDAQVEGVRVVSQRARRRPPAGHRRRRRTLACGLVIRAVGYRGRAIDGVPFDEASGTIPNQDGRVGDRVYVAGWIKRGPSGIIGTNKKDANETVATLLADREAGRLGPPPKDRDEPRTRCSRART